MAVPPSGKVDLINANDSYFHLRGFKQDGGNHAFCEVTRDTGGSTGNTAFSCGEWKQKFKIYFKATGALRKPDETKIGLLLNLILNSV